jgi:hypothetical protein
MSKIYTVGRGSAADIKIPKEENAVGKVHLQIEDAGPGQARVTDLKSTNGTFLREGAKWAEIKEARVVALDAELMLGDYKTTPRRLLAEALTVPLHETGKPKKYRSSKEEETPPVLPAKKRTGPRRNEFGEIVHE